MGTAREGDRDESTGDIYEADVEVGSTGTSQAALPGWRVADKRKLTFSWLTDILVASNWDVMHIGCRPNKLQVDWGWGDAITNYHLVDQSAQRRTAGVLR